MNIEKFLKTKSRSVCLEYLSEIAGIVYCYGICHQISIVLFYKYLLLLCALIHILKPATKFDR